MNSGLKVFVGTVVRSAPLNQGGHFIEIDWTTKNVKKEISVMPKNPSIQFDYNPRGNSRGCRGITVLDDLLLPNTKVVDRDKSDPASDILTLKQKEWIKDVCKQEFILMGYET